VEVNMTRRQQLILFVLALTTMSICVVAFAMAMNLTRRMAVSASAAEDLSSAEMESEEGLAWEVPEPAAEVPAAEGQGAAAPAYVVASATPTREPTPTNTRVPTWTPAPTYTPTATRVPTETPVPTPTDTPLPPPTSDAPPPAAAPSVPTPTATPAFPFLASAKTFDTGTPQVTRITGMVWKVVDRNQALYDGQAGYHMRLVNPYGGVFTSDVSGPGGTDSTCLDCGDNQRMNMKVETSPYVPGTYRVALMQGDTQVSPELELTLVANPPQYVHVDFSPWR
jgi:hypothetical protein